MSEGGGRSGMVTSRRALALAVPFILGGLAIGRHWVPIHPAEAEPDVRPTATPAFPLVVTPGKRHLRDAEGKPFLIHGDTAWSLIAQLTREEVDRYLDDRRARGFNTILVSLIENNYAANPPANAYGEQPFVTPGNFATPNKAYFRHANWVLRRAAKKGFLVLLTPSYVGCCSDGWYQEMIVNGPDRLRQYGKYLGRRYRDFTNILWVHAGDHDPPEKNLVRAIAEGIRKVDRRALHTAHGAAETAALDYWSGEPWLQVNNVYTYGAVCAPALEQYARPGRMPFFLIESTYENEHEATERLLRTQAYHAVLCGAAGQVFGNNPIWHFDSPNHWPAPVTWQEALGSRGAQSMTHLHDLLTAVRWWKLKPDRKNTLLIEGVGEWGDRAVAARSSDRSFALLYLPSSRDITVDLGELAGPEVAARWYDPANGRFSSVSGSPFRASGSRRFRPEPDTNSSGFDDWALLLKSQS
ncbi:MAG: glycoside hydrolase family 140 protein [Geminicoccaceae bacterium]